MDMNKAEFEKNYPNRRKIVGVFGGGEPCDSSLATPIGQLIARKGFHLLTGAGGGVMAQVSEAFYNVKKREGLVIGIIRAGVPYDQDFKGTQREYKPNDINEWIEIPIYTHLRRSGRHGKKLDSRNPINALASDAVIVLPGGPGTNSEVELALEYGVPVIFYLGGKKVGSDEPGDYITRYRSSRAVDAKSIEEVEAELDRIFTIQH
jgi:uncharacterized protein (TIGR00725 family)